MKEEEKTFPRRMLVWNNDKNIAREEIVVFIDSDRSCIAKSAKYNDNDGAKRFANCEELPTKNKRQMTNAEVFKAIRDGAVVKVNTGNLVNNYWSTFYNQKDYKICYNYTGTDADVWQEMEVEE